MNLSNIEDALNIAENYVMESGWTRHKDDELHVVREAIEELKKLKELTEIVDIAVGEYPEVYEPYIEEGMVVVKWKWRLLQNEASRMDRITRRCKELLNV